jgi:hypothetical protein
MIATWSAEARTIHNVEKSVAFGEIWNRKRIYISRILGTLMTPNNDVSLKKYRGTTVRCTIAVRTSFAFNKIHHLQDFDPPSPAVWHGIISEGMMLWTICDPKIENGVYRRRYSFEYERKSGNPDVIKVVKTSRLRFAMNRRPEDLPRKAVFIAKPQGRTKSRWP